MKRKDCDSVMSGVGSPRKKMAKLTSWDVSGQARTKLRSLNDGLCERCSKINLDAVFSRTHKQQVGRPVEDLGPVTNWAIDSCALCRFMAEVVRARNDRSNFEYQLRSYSSRRVPHMGWKSIDTVLLEIQSSFIISQSERSGPVRLLEDSINFNIPLSWLNLCRDKHKRTCSVRNPSRVPLLKLIDCVTRRIVPAQDNQYLALSYVWGASPDAKNEDFCVLPENLPATIKDAIAVTSKLGFRYLWIDRYCISRTNEQEFREQIGQMDLIYQGAEVTIVAAAGEDPAYGLPGVDSRNRVHQPGAKVGKYFLVSAPEDARISIRTSKWMSRAWTYQEALLSRRRLIFSDQQIYYECRGMYCCEALNFDLLGQHTNNGERFRAEYCHGQDIGMFPSNGVGKTPKNVLDCIEEYSTRTLTNKSDLLNGILGIFRAFERSSLAIRHCWGVPIVDLQRKVNKPNTVSQLSTRNSISGFIVGLCWDLRESSTRLSDFPSWSWTGWVSNVQWTVLFRGDYEWKSLKVDLDLEISIELCDGRILDWHTFHQSYEQYTYPSTLSHFIHLSAWTISLPISERDYEPSHDHPRETRYKARIGQEDGSYVLWGFNAATSRPLTNQLCTGICLGIGDDRGPPSGQVQPLILVVATVGENIERVGWGWMDLFSYEWYTSDGERDFNLHRIPILKKSFQKIRLG